MSSVAVYCSVLNHGPRIGFLFRELLMTIMKTVVGNLISQEDHRLFFQYRSHLVREETGRYELT